MGTACGERGVMADRLGGPRGEPMSLGLYGALPGSPSVCGSINRDVFHAWVNQDVMPKRPDKAVLVMDNASFHTREEIQQAMTEAGHTLAYLPPYRPDLNPIEQTWAQAKAIRRKKPCSIEALFKEAKLKNHYYIV